MRVAQVTAKLGETTVDVAYIAPGERYTIGTARDTRLAITGVCDFPLVTGEPRGLVVRRPVGLGTLVVDGRTCDDAEAEVVLASLAAGDRPNARAGVALAGADRVTFELGLVTISIELVARAAMPVPRPELERRTPAFVVASLIVHLLVWGAAITFAHPPRAKRPRPAKQAHPVLVHLAVAPVPVPAPAPGPVPPSPATQRAMPAASRANPTSAGPSQRGRVAESSIPIGGDRNAQIGAAVAQLAAAMPDVGKALDQVGPLYVPSAVDPAFGGAAKFDPRTRPDWGSLTIVTGRYRTISSGRGVGDNFDADEDPVPASQGLALCESRRCEVSGGLAKADLQEVAATRGPALERCMARGAVMLELDIAPDGRVTKVHGEGTTARCVATVIASLAFPAADEATHATFTIGYP
jgi:hypothetical protein